MIKKYNFFSVVLFLVASMQQALHAQWSQMGMSIDAKKTELAQRAAGVPVPLSLPASIQAATSHITLDALEKLVGRSEEDLYQLEHQWVDDNHEVKEARDFKQLAPAEQHGVIQALQNKFKGIALCLLAVGIPVGVIISYFMMSMGLRASEDVQNMLGAELLDICLGACKLVDHSATDVNTGSNYRACLALPWTSRMKACGRLVGGFAPQLLVGYVVYRLYKLCCGARRRA